MATVLVTPGDSDGYQITYLPDGSLLLTKFESLSTGDVIEWDDKFAAVAPPTGWAGKLFGVSSTKLQGLTIGDIL